MNHPVAVVVVVVVLVGVAAVAAFVYSRQRRSKLLREHYGPEYDRVVGKEKNVRRAEGVLEFREKAREMLEIRPLSRTDQVTFASRWNAVQRQFVDDPQAAVGQADQLVSETMAVRGYPVESFEQRAELVSVDHPVVVQNYRAAHDIALRQRQGRATTEDLRKAMVHYRSLFDELLKDTPPEERKEARG
jgi:hypothetical protein